ncbi:unnamed protein product [Calypogeia fissa]
MSLRYAEKLSYRADVGAVGMPEFFDSPTVLQSKIAELAKLIKQSKHLVVFTGAGISTSCGIPDFRGPNGIWTLQHEGKPMPTAGTPFHQARPGVTHMALVGLQRAGILKYIISQNIDGLHLRSGIPRSQLAELHGNCFREVCGGCGKDYVRDFEMETIGLRPTGRRCSVPDCSSKLLDTIVDWEDALPPSELKLAEKHSKQADLTLCLGTSLQITPACNLPMKTVRAGGKLVIVNLQATPKDKNAVLVVHARVDEVIQGVMNELHLQIPPYVRVDCLRVSYYYAMTRKKSVKWVLRIASTHGNKAPVPFLESVEITFPDRPDLKSATWTEQPFLLRRITSKVKSLDIMMKLQFGNGSMCSSTETRHTLYFESNAENGLEGDREGSLETLRLRAAEDSLCGQAAPIEIRQPTDGTKGSIVDYGIVTSVVSHAPNVIQQSGKRRQPERKVEEKIETDDSIREKSENGGRSSPQITYRKRSRKTETDDETEAKAENGTTKPSPVKRYRKRARKS